LKHAGRWETCRPYSRFKSKKSKTSDHFVTLAFRMDLKKYVITLWIGFIWLKIGTYIYI